MKSYTGFAILGLTIAMVLFGRSAFGAVGEAGVPFEAEKAANLPEPKLVVTGTACKAVKFDFATSDTTGVVTTSTAFVDMPDMSVTFKVAGNNRCLKVDFSAYSFAAGGGLIMVRALLDGTTVGAPGPEVQFDGDTTQSWARSHSFSFAFVGVSAGFHNVTIQWRSFTGSAVAVHRRSLFVYHQ